MICGNIHGKISIGRVVDLRQKRIFEDATIGSSAGTTVQAMIEEHVQYNTRIIDRHLGMISSCTNSTVRTEIRTLGGLALISRLLYNSCRLTVCYPKLSSEEQKIQLRRSTTTGL